MYVLKTIERFTLTFFKCLFTHFVNVFFCMASLSSENRRKCLI